MIVLTNKPQTEDEYQYSSTFISVCEDAYVMRLHSTNPDEDDIDVIMNEDELQKMSTYPKGCKLAYEFASIMQDGKQIYSLEIEYNNGEYGSAYIEEWDRFKDFISWSKAKPNWMNTYSYKINTYKHSYIKTRPIVCNIPSDWEYSKTVSYLLDLFKDDLDKLKLEIDNKYDKIEYEGQEFEYTVEKEQLIKDAKRKFMKPAYKGPIIKFINGNNNDKNYIKDTYEYIAAPSKTDNGRLVTTYGVAGKDPVAWMITVKRVWHKTNGKQGEHFIVSFPEDFDKTPDDLLKIMREIVEANFHGYSAVIAVHLDAIHLHSHVLLNSVSWENGKKFSQSPSDLNKLKLKINEILNNHGINIIRDSVNHMRISSETNEIPEGE